METYFSVIKQSILFQGVEDRDLSRLLECLSSRNRSFEKNQFILSAGDERDRLGVVLCGKAQIIHEDYWGNRSILGVVEPGELFGEAFSFSDADSLPVSVLATEKTTVLFMDSRRIVAPCAHACAFHRSMIENMVRLLATKNMELLRKIDHVTKRSTREKLLSYLSSQAQKAGSNSFTIPFNREQLANYLSVDRSAMSGELSRMREEGLLEFRKSAFILHSIS